MKAETVPVTHTREVSPESGDRTTKEEVDRKA